MARAPKFDDAEILDRAMVTFWRRGWSGTSIRDLERALDLKAPSIYRRFGTKEGLGIAAIEHYVGRVVRRRVDKHLSGDGDPIANIAAFLDRSVTQPANGDESWGCLLTTTSIDAGPLDPGLAEAIGRGLDVIEAGLRREVRRAADTGRLRSGTDVESAVSSLVLATQGLMALARGGAPAAQLQRHARGAVEIVAAAEPA